VTLTAYDSVDVAHLPDGADAYFGYVAGRWPTWAALKARFEGKAHLVSIAIAADEHALCLDIETGDAQPWQAPGWVQAEHGRNVARPVLYASVSRMAAVVGYLHRHGVPLASVRLLSAHYGAGKHICGPGTCKQIAEPMDGTQWTDAAAGAGGAKVDESLLAADFFAPPPPPPAEVTYAAVRLKDGVTRLVVSTDGGKTLH